MMVTTPDCDLCHAAPGVQRRDGRLLCVECVAGWDYQAALTAEERIRDEQAIERYRQETLDEQPQTRRRREEWRARARLTGDPEASTANIEHERTVLCAATHTPYKNCGVECCVPPEEVPDGPR